MRFAQFDIRKYDLSRICALKYSKTSGETVYNISTMIFGFKIDRKKIQVTTVETRSRGGYGYHIFSVIS